MATKKEKEQQVDKVREQLSRHAKHFKDTFKTIAGKKVLKTLQESFLKQSMMGETPEKTAYNVGQHDLIQYITEMVEMK